MRKILFLGADHAGFALKEKIKLHLASRGIAAVDLTPRFIAKDDYPEIAMQLAREVAKRKGALGILVCGSGVGMAIGANRIKGIRAFDAYDAKTTRLARAHTNANVIALSGWRLSATQAMALIKLFLTTRFSRATRHRRRVKQLG